ncbi:hypothetical protein RZS08_67165, partial [Arthrospira platensis SPKY1]|nr:hypothetical protein [Arthrospira platensis SPKY1]
MQIVDSANNSVSLDDYYMVRVQDNDTIMTMANNEFQDPLTEGIVIFTSGNFEQTSKSGMQFRFTGYLNGQQVVNELYTFNRDDCHFNYVSGKQKIV